jgi:predicted amidophosphoribosyltransferase
MNIIARFIDGIFPPSHHENIMRQYTNATFSALYEPTMNGTVTILAPYHHQAIQAAIQATKFEQSILAAKHLGALVATHLNTLPPAPTLFIPIPLSRARERERGFNQVARVLSFALTNRPHSILTTTILYRHKNVVPQTTHDRAGRLTNIKGIFSVDTKRLVASVQKHKITDIYICDDVMTTGTTLAEATTTLRPHLPPQVTLHTIAWAH